VLEAGSVHQIFRAPKDAYTRALLAAVPSVETVSMNAKPTDNHALLSAKQLSKSFSGGRAFGIAASETKAVDDVSLDILQGETLALVGESGSGKSTLGRILARLTKADQGSVTLGATNLLSLEGAPLRQERRKIQMIFQDPYASLDPRQSIGAAIAEPIKIQTTLSKAARQERVAQLLTRVGLTADMARRFPHEFSGGQRQRVAIARAIAAGPELIIADEPTSALDVSIQAQILELLSDLKSENGLTMLFISHDLAVVRQVSDRVAVMRQGRILELGPTEAVWGAPRHPYTKALIDAAPIPDPSRKRAVRSPILDTFKVAPLSEAAPGHWVAL
jgi:peptide/nickel transport system ATP-binding protein